MTQTIRERNSTTLIIIREKEVVMVQQIGPTFVDADRPKIGLENAGSLLIKRELLQPLTSAVIGAVKEISRTSIVGPTVAATVRIVVLGLSTTIPEAPRVLQVSVTGQML
jgi:hypothetical protein